ncbi:MAG: hypothetical protein Q9227_002919 [Pyrenula ochraceoflavens]
MVPREDLRSFFMNEIEGPGAKKQRLDRSVYVEQQVVSESMSNKFSMRNANAGPLRPQNVEEYNLQYGEPAIIDPQQTLKGKREVTEFISPTFTDCVVTNHKDSSPPFQKPPTLIKASAATMPAQAEPSSAGIPSSSFVPGTPYESPQMEQTALMRRGASTFSNNESVECPPSNNTHLGGLTSTNPKLNAQKAKTREMFYNNGVQLGPLNPGETIPTNATSLQKTAHYLRVSQPIDYTVPRPYPNYNKLVNGEISQKFIMDTKNRLNLELDFNHPDSIGRSKLDGTYVWPACLYLCTPRVWGEIHQLAQKWGGTDSFNIQVLDNVLLDREVDFHLAKAAFNDPMSHKHRGIGTSITSLKTLDPETEGGFYALAYYTACNTVLRKQYWNKKDVRAPGNQCLDATRGIDAAAQLHRCLDATLKHMVATMDDNFMLPDLRMYSSYAEAWCAIKRAQYFQHWKVMKCSYEAWCWCPQLPLLKQCAFEGLPKRVDLNGNGGMWGWDPSRFVSEEKMAVSLELDGIEWWAQFHKWNWKGIEW